MNTLTDILGLNKRNNYVTHAKDEDMVILGTVQAPTIEGIAGPIPPHDIKLIRISDLFKSDECIHQNIPTADTAYAGVFRDRTTDPLTEQCYINLRRFKSLSLNLTITENGDFIDIENSAEANTASNLGSGSQIFKSKVGLDLQFRSLLSSDSTITITQNTNDIDLIVRSGKLSISNSSGIKTFYSTLAAAITAGSAGQTITFETDITETSVAAVTLKTGVDIDLNGHSYTFSDTATTNALIDGGVAVVCNIYNGTIIRSGQSLVGTATTALPIYLTAVSEINFNNSVVVENGNGYAINFKGTVKNLTASGTAGCVVLDGAANLYNSNTEATTGTAIETAGTITAAHVEGCTGVSTGAPGISIGSVATGDFILKDSIGTSNDSAGILLTGLSANKVEGYDVIGNSNTNIGVSCTFSVVIGGRGYSVSGTAIQLTNGHYTDCHGYTHAGNGADFVTNATSSATYVNCSGVTDTGGYGGSANVGAGCFITMQNCDFTNNQDSASAHAFSITNSNDIDILGGTFSVYNSSANCLHSTSGGAVTVGFSDCIFKTGTASGTPVDSNITNDSISVSNLATSSGLFVGAMKIDGAATITGNTQIDGQAYTPTSTISDPGSGAIAVDFDNSNVQKITLTASAAYTLSNPTNLKEGGTYMIVVSQPAVTGAATMAFGSSYLWEGGTAPTLTAAAGAIDLLAFLCVDVSGLKLVSTSTQNYS